eukprot:TRINITY_DN1096_c0_g1_i7.p2 TRINITY_DN1096_c0_g1~~TRINITY_DN1096_c0_g1_i7.p2  ORF type:complete len:182 (-),score=57.13 TRINITY_DN1096_c0_g1_i7:115-660(-)
MKIVEDTLKHMKKRGDTIDEDTLVHNIIQAAQSKVQEVRLWEQTALGKREEIRKMTAVIDKDKLNLITTMITKDPYVSLEELENRILEEGFIGFSHRDKILVYREKLVYFTLRKFHLLKEVATEIFEKEKVEAESQLAQTEKIIADLEEKMKDEMTIFRSMFKNSQMFREPSDAPERSPHA